MFDKQHNPYYRLLMRGQASRVKDRQKRRTRWIQVFILIAALPIIFNEAFALSCCCSYMLLFLPIMMATTFAQSSASDTRSADYELIMLTPLENDDIVWGQFYSTLDRNLLSRQFPYGLAPVAFSTILSGLFIAFVLEESNETDLILPLISVSLSFAGLYWLLGFAGIALGLALRKPGMASWLMAGISFTMLFLWGLLAAIVSNPDSQWPVYVIFALVPYLPIVPILFLAYRFARNPVISPPSI